jgi:hypothetical protein
VVGLCALQRRLERVALFFEGIARFVEGGARLLEPGPGLVGGLPRAFFFLQRAIDCRALGLQRIDSRLRRGLRISGG